jgi:hypothetical protein
MTPPLSDAALASQTTPRVVTLARRGLSLTRAIAAASAVLVAVSTVAFVDTARGDEPAPVVAAGEVSPSPTDSPSPAETTTPEPVFVDTTATLSRRQEALQTASRAGLSAGRFRTKAYSVAYAREWGAFAYGWNGQQITCLNQLWQSESSWRWNAKNRRTGAYGIPQALPGTKMAVAGRDWKTNPETQIRWGMSYISARYGTPCKAYSFKKVRRWY